MRDKKYRKPAVITMFLLFIFLSVILVFLFAIIIPFLMTFSTGMYSMGNSILSSPIVQGYIGSISDTNISTQINASFASAQASTQTNIQVLGYLFQFGWLIIIIIILFILWMKTRLLVETQQGMGIF